MNLLFNILRRTTQYPSIFYWILSIIFIQRNYFPKIIRELPFGIHDWAQADRCSIALAYYHNTLNVFDMATLNMVSEGGKVGTELPLIAYIASLIARVTDVTMIYPVFRSINLFIVFLGGYFLFRLIYRYTNSILIGLIGGFFSLLSTNTMFYTCNFLSDAPAMGLVYISFYYFIISIENNQRKDVIFFVVFSSLAILLKMSTIGYVLSVSIMLCFYFFKRKLYKNILILAIPFILFILQYLYIQYRLQLFHSPIFLTGIIGFKSFQEFEEISIMFKNYLLEHYFPLSQISLWLGIVSVFLISNTKETQSKISFQKAKILIGLMLFFVFILYYCFGFQFNVHDYYFISMCLPFFSICFVFAIIYLHDLLKFNSNVHRYVFTAMFIQCFLTYCYLDHKFLKINQGFSDNMYLENYRHRSDLYYGHDIMNQLGIAMESKILVVNDHTPNLTFSHFNRKGHIVYIDNQLNFESTLLNESKTKKANYVIMKKRDFNSFAPKELVYWKIIYQRERLVILGHNHTVTNNILSVK